MLSDYLDSQGIACNLLMNEIKNDHISHAYLFDENNFSESFNIVMAFVKEILCYKLSENERELLCKRIDAGNYPEIKIIEPDGMLIKKQQILDLQQEFSRSAVEGNKRIYIIRDADKMRPEAANSMLKFLEEPENNIIAILMTNNYNNLLSTIISRCQVIRLNKGKNEHIICELDNLALSFVKSIELLGVKTLTKEFELIFNSINVKERDAFVIFFDKLIDIYYDILKISNGGAVITYHDNLDEFAKIAKNNTQEKLLNKINTLIDMKDRIKNNVNINLLIDSLIVSIGGM